jgi:hypothetical protein
MKRSKLSLLVILIILLTGFVSADNHVEFPEIEISYGNFDSIDYEAEYMIVCDNSQASCPGSPVVSSSNSASLKLKGCTGTERLDSTGGDWGGEIGDDKTLYRGGINIPRNFQCGLGSHEMELRFNGGEVVDSGGNIEVTPKGGMQPNKGKYMRIGADVKNAAYRDLILTNDNSDNPAKIYVEEIDRFSGNEFGAFTPKVGNYILPTSDCEDSNLCSDGSIDNRLANLVEGSIEDGDGGTSNSIGNDNCGDDPCKIMNVGWKNSITSRGNRGKKARNLESATPFMIKKDFRPDGELVYGQVPKFFDENDRESDTDVNKFYICREGSTMYNGFGDEIPQVVDLSPGRSQSLWQCDQTSGNWGKISECNDGLDNDGDGYIDHPNVNLASGVEPDPSCTSESASEGDSVPPPEDCENIVYLNDQDEVVYQFLDSNSDSCNQKTLSSFLNELSPHPIDTFKCKTSSGTVVPEDFDNKDEDLARANQFCASKTLHNDQNSDHVKAVEFKPKKEYFLAKFEEVSGSDDGLTVTEATPTGWKGQFFLGSNGWRTGMQTLHQAEEFYSGSQDPHEASTWASLGMKNTIAYDTSPSSYKDAWESSNAGTVSTGDTAVASELFPGGFHGKCTGENTWDKGNEWGCIGDGMLLEFFEVNPYAYEEDDEDYEQKNYTAIRLTESEANKWEAYTGLSPTGEQNVLNLEIRARCWHGNPNQRPSNSENILAMSKQVSGGNTVLVGQLPIRDELFGNGVTGDHRTYSCNYGFQQGITSLSKAPEEHEIFYNGGPRQPGQNPQGVRLPFYIVEGSNENGIIKSQTTSVRPPENFDWDEANSSTNKPPIINDFFLQFPTGEGGNTGQGGSDPGQIRNPLNVCRTINNLCN